MNDIIENIEMLRRVRDMIDNLGEKMIYQNIIDQGTKLLLESMKDE